MLPRGRCADHPNSLPGLPTSTAAVCDRLCGSTPIITAMNTSPIELRGRPGRALLIRNARTAAPLSNHAPARTSMGQHLVRKPVGVTDGKQLENATRRDPRRYEQPRNATTNSIRQSWRVALASAFQAPIRPAELGMPTEPASIWVSRWPARPIGRRDSERDVVVDPGSRVRVVRSLRRASVRLS
jgi:hypothetical protein